MGARPFDISLMTPANATDMNRFSPKHKPTVPESHHSLNLRTPSSFVQKSSVPPSLSTSDAVNGIRNRGFESPSRDRSPATMARTEIVCSPALGRSSHENSPHARYHHALSSVRNDAEVTNSQPVGGSINPPLHFATSNRIADGAYTSLSGRNDSASARSDTLFASQNSDIATSGPISGSHNPAVQFAAANMLADRDRPYEDGNRGLNYATSNTLNDDDQQLASSADSRLHSSRIAAENLATSSLISGTYTPKSSVQQLTDRRICETSGADSDLAKNREIDNSLLADRKLQSTGIPAEGLATSDPISGAYNSKSSVQQLSDRRTCDTSGTDSDLARNREIENSLLADRMLNEALLPPSAIHAADIIGSTLDEKGLSFIREKLTSKYSAKDESVGLQSPTRARELERRDQLGNGARSKRAEQLRRQGAFDKESDRSDVIAAMKNPSGSKISEEDILASNHGESCHSSSGVDDRSAVRHACPEILGDTRCSHSGLCSSKDNNFSGGGALKDVSGNEPWMQIYRGICDNYLTNQGHQSQGGVQQDENNSASEKGASGDSSMSSDKKALKAELTSYGTGSEIVRSEALHNPSFPEEAVVSSGIVQNPVSVDRLRGAMEEMSVTQAKTQSCHKCQDGIRAGDVVVTAEKANDCVWHPGCFVCSVCDELLADLVYFYYKGKLYCGRDLATLLEIPRCFACDEVSNAVAMSLFLSDNISSVYIRRHVTSELKGAEKKIDKLDVSTDDDFFTANIRARVHGCGGTQLPRETLLLLGLRRAISRTTVHLRKRSSSVSSVLPEDVCKNLSHLRGCDRRRSAGSRD